GYWRPTNATQSNNTDRAGGSPGGSPVGGSPANSDGLVFLARTRAVRNWQIELSDDAGTVWPFNGFISSFHPGAIGIQDVVRFTAEIMPTRDTAAALP